MSKYAVVIFRLFCFAFFVGTIQFPSVSVAIAAEKRVAVLPFDVNAASDLSYLQQGIRDMLASRLAGGDVLIIEKAKIDAAAAARKMPLAEADYRHLAQEIGADYVIGGSITALGGGVSIDAKAIPAAGSEAMKSFFATAGQEGEVIAAINDIAWDLGADLFGRQRPASRSVAPMAAESANPVATAHPERALRLGAFSGKGSALIMPEGIGGLWGFTKSQNFDIALQGMDMGDVDGDGQEEVVLAGASEVIVCRPGPVRFDVIGRHAANPRYRIHAVNTADLDGNGREEIYVSAADSQQPQSFALEWNGSALVPLFQNANWYIRPLTLPGEGLVLAGQKDGAGGIDSSSSRSTSLFPAIYRLSRSGGKLQAGAKIEIPESINLFDFAMADLDGNGGPEIIAIDNQERIRVMHSDGRVVWKSEDHFGGTKRYIGGEETNVPQTSTAKEMEERVYVPSRIVVTDVNSDGLPDLVINKNPPTATRVFENYKSYPTGEIHAFTWNGIALSEIWRTRKIDGYVVDYQLRPTGDAGAQLVVGLMLQSGWLNVVSSPESTVLTYSLEFSKEEPGS